MEQFTLNTLGYPDGMPHYKCPPSHDHNRFQPRTQAGRDAKVAKELERMTAHAQLHGGVVDSKYLTGEPFEHENLKKYPPPEESIIAESGQSIKTSSFSVPKPLVGVQAH